MSTPLALVLPYVPCDTYTALEQTCGAAARFVARRRRRAARTLARWLRRNQLPPVSHFLWDNTQVTKKTLIRHYMARYPDEHIDSMIALFPRKLRRPELARVGRGLARRRAFQLMLQSCATLEIMYVGW